MPMSRLRNDLEDLPITSSTVPAVILILPKTQEYFFANSKAEKRKLLKRYNEEKKKADKSKAKNKIMPVMVSVWPRQWSSHAFFITGKKLSEAVV